MRAKSATPKAVREVMRRRQLFSERRFNKPLKIFFEKKYPAIFAEYVKFYEHMNRLTPTKKDLTKSIAFKYWLESQPQLSEISSSQMAEIPSSSQVVNTLESQPQLSEISSSQMAEIPSSSQVVNTLESQPQLSEILSSSQVDPTFESLVEELLENDVMLELFVNDLTKAFGEGHDEDHNI